MNNITFKMSFIIRYADQITIGDEVLIQENDKLIHGIVTSVSSSIMQGDIYFLKVIFMLAINIKQVSLCAVLVTKMLIS